MDNLQKIANRIALGLVLAALIVGAALMMQVRHSFRLFGYPGLAMLLFLLAAACGFILISQRPLQRRLAGLAGETKPIAVGFRDRPHHEDRPEAAARRAGLAADPLLERRRRPARGRSWSAPPRRST